MWIKYHEEAFTPYEYVEFDEASMNWNTVCLYKDDKLIKKINLLKVNFFYISEEDPRKQRR